MTRHLLYVTGQPASGKSSLCAALTDGLRFYVDRAPFGHTVYGGPTVPTAALGVPRDGFPGTDTLSMSVAPKVLAWLPTCRYEHVLGEGDRLATVKFLDGARAAGFTVVHVHLDAPDDVIAARLAGRVGWEPSPAWLAGRRTKSRNLAKVADLVLDTSLGSPEYLASCLGFRSPVADGLFGAPRG